MKHIAPAMRKMLFILLVVVMLTVTVGTGLVSAGGPSGPPEKPKVELVHPKLCNYTVRRGDTLFSLARRFGTSVWQLASANHIVNVNLIRTGQHLNVPCGEVERPKEPCCVQPKPVKELCCVYRVKCGDTLSRIAAMHGTTVWQLASANHIANPNRIFAGQWLRVPCWDR